MRLAILFSAITFSASTLASATTLVSEETISQQKKLTKMFRLHNHIPVIYRQVPGSDILNIQVTFKTGMRDLKPGAKNVNQLLFDVMPLAASDFPKEKVYRLTEKYALGLDCSGGVEVSSCSLNTINDYWEQGVELFAAIIKSPSLTDDDIGIKREQLLADIKGQAQDPGALANDVVNRIFYPSDHPYFQPFAASISEIPKISRGQLTDLHKQILNSQVMVISVATSLDADALVKSLNKYFSSIPNADLKRDPVPAPLFKKEWTVNFEEQKIPSAYIQMKFNAKSAADKDVVAAKLLFNLLDEELGDEVRTKRSLSYSVYSYTIQYDAGIGVIGASTSKPKETLEAISDVIKRLKTRDYSRKELEEYKTTYATNYYLTQEEHASLSSALANSYIYYGTTDVLYEFPAKLDKVTPRDIKNLANELLNNFRVGVVYDRKKFEDSWAKELVKKNLKKS